MNINKFITSRDLKIIAYVTMLIDHIGATIFINLLANYGNYNINMDYQQIYDTYNILRTIGRISFPIFTFCIVEGFINTKDIKKYIFRLFIFAIISEIPFNLAIGNNVTYFQAQNVIWTFLLGIIALYCGKIVNNRFFEFVFIIAAMIIAEIFKTDYSAYGILLLFAYYYLRDFPIKYLIWGIIIYYNTAYGLISLIPMFLYNGQKGMKSGRWLYGFYPVHFLILYGVILIINNTFI